MNRRTYLAVCAVFALGTAMAAEPSTLEVKLNYTGAGTVDEKHKIVLFLFDSPDFTQGNAMPIGSAMASAKDEVVKFKDIAKGPVYVVAAFDPKGEYDGQSGPPPSGSSLGMLIEGPNAPKAIALEPGKTTTITLTFNDMIKMP